ncbi:MAG: hypothetical protein NWQ26_00125, partial [Paraglaciecola sp.]|nr:hypothetical protein [Paraglaciecola sp.]
MLFITQLNKISRAVLEHTRKPAFITAVCAIAIMVGVSASARSQEFVIDGVAKYQSLNLNELTVAGVNLERLDTTDDINIAKGETISATDFASYFHPLRSVGDEYG